MCGLPELTSLYFVCLDVYFGCLSLYFECLNFYFGFGYGLILWVSQLTLWIYRGAAGARARAVVPCG